MLGLHLRVEALGRTTGWFLRTGSSSMSRVSLNRYALNMFRFRADGFGYPGGIKSWVQFIRVSVQAGALYEPESLILAQSERWRHA